MCPVNFHFCRSSDLDIAFNQSAFINNKLMIKWNLVGIPEHSNLTGICSLKDISLPTACEFEFEEKAMSARVAII